MSVSQHPQYKTTLHILLHPYTVQPDALWWVMLANEVQKARAVMENYS